MNQNAIIVVVAIVAAILLLVLVLRSRRQHVGFDAAAPLPRASTPPAPARVAVAEPDPAPIEEGHGVGSEMTAAIEDVVDQFIGVDAHPSGAPVRTGAGDELTRLKGLGPKAASLLTGLGVTTFAQIAAWDEGDVAAVDARLGAFKGRIARDRWVEQAALLAKGDTDGFEAKFGKLGG